MYKRQTQESFKTFKLFRNLTFTLSPEADSLEELWRYGRNRGAKNKWIFAQPQSKESAFAIAEKALKMDVVNDTVKMYSRTNDAALIDRRGRVRGYYSVSDSASMQLMVNDIFYLMYKGREDEEEL